MAQALDGLSPNARCLIRPQGLARAVHVCIASQDVISSARSSDTGFLMRTRSRGGGRCCFAKKNDGPMTSSKTHNAQQNHRIALDERRVGANTGGSARALCCTSWRI